MSERTVGNHRGRWRPDEGMDGIPRAVDVRDLVSDKLNEEKGDRYAEDYGVSEHLEGIGELDYAEALEQARRRYGEVDVETRSERRAEGKAEGLEGGHTCKVRRERERKSVSGE